MLSIEWFYCVFVHKNGQNLKLLQGPWFHELLCQDYGILRKLIYCEVLSGKRVIFTIMELINVRYLHALKVQEM